MLHKNDLEKMQKELELSHKNQIEKLQKELELQSKLYEDNLKSDLVGSIFRDETDIDKLVKSMEGIEKLMTQVDKLNSKKIPSNRR